MQKIVRYYCGMTDIGGCFYYGYDETEDPVQSGISFKFTFSEDKKTTMIETQANGITKKLFASIPAIVEYEYESDRIIVSFKDGSGNQTRHADADKCILQKIKNGNNLAASFYCGEKRITDSYGRYETIFKFDDDKISEWTNYDANYELKNIKYGGFAGSTYKYDLQRRMCEINFFDESGNPAQLKYIDYRGECGSPGPDKNYYYSKQKYIYDGKGNFIGIWYFDGNDRKVFPKYFEID